MERRKAWEDACQRPSIFNDRLETFETIDSDSWPEVDDVCEALLHT